LTRVRRSLARQPRRGSRALTALAAAAALTACVACGTDTVVAVRQAEDGAPPITTNPLPAPGFLSTRGSRIVDSNGNDARIRAVSWFGLESQDFAPHGLWTRGLDSVLAQIVSLGFDTVRVPFSTQLFDPGNRAPNVDVNQNPDLVGLDGAALLDRLVDHAEAHGLRIILDRHRPDADSQSPQPALWYTDAYDEARFIDDWKMLAARYKGRSTVIGFELNNDVHDPATWGDGNASTDWRDAAKRTANAVLAINPDVLVLVDGIETANGTQYWWGGNLAPVRTLPLTLDVVGKLVYATSDYSLAVAQGRGKDYAWLRDPAYPDNLPSVWNDAWGYLRRDDIAPVFVAGFGTLYQTDADKAWLGAIARYVEGLNSSFAYWCLNPDSGDTGGLLQDDWSTVQAGKLQALAPLLSR
jgi:aryl-phospho-beta-D-glucosidase BglC (GH1 family)